MPDEPNMDEIKKMASEEAYWRGRCEEADKSNQRLIELIKHERFYSATERTVGRSIGAGSTIIYGQETLGASQWRTIWGGASSVMLTLVLALFLVDQGAIGYSLLPILLFSLIKFILTYTTRTKDKKSREESTG